MLIKRVLTFTVFTLFSQPIFAAGTVRFTFETLEFAAQPPQPVEQNESLLKTEYERRFRVARSMDFELHPFVRVSSLKEAREERVLFDPREAFIEWRRSKNFLRAGFFTLKWEGTDGLNPMDIASMKDWSDPLNPETKSSGGIALGRNTDLYDFEAAWIPRQTPSSLPGRTSAWLPRQIAFPIQQENIELRLPERAEYVYLPRREADDALKNTFASRLQFHGSGGDAAIAYYEGAAATPSIIPTVDVTPISVGDKYVFQLTNPIEIRAVDYRTRSVAGMASTTVGEYILRISSRYDQPVGSEKTLPTWSQATVGGVEHTFQFGANSVTALLQGSFVRKPEGSGLLSVSDIFDRSILYGFRFPLGENWLFLVSGFNNTKDKSFYTRHQVGYRVSDHWRTDFTLEFLEGPSESLLGIFSRNDRAVLSLSGVF